LPCYVDYKIVRLKNNFVHFLSEGARIVFWNMGLNKCKEVAFAYFSVLHNCSSVQITSIITFGKPYRLDSRFTEAC
jgi:hypothetical protein